MSIWWAGVPLCRYVLRTRLRLGLRLRLRGAAGYAALAAVFAGLGALPLLGADEKKQTGPVITAIAPLEIVPGTTVTLHIRGLRLDTAAGITFAGEGTPLTVQIKEKKKADLLNGLEAKDIGDTQVEASVTVPADLPVGTVRFTVTTPDGTTPSHDLRVAEAATLIEEKEPNDGFQSAQPLEFGKTLRGSIKADKDVDVFQFKAQAKQCIHAEVRAARLGSLLDGVLNLFDARGNLVATCDDFAGGRDSQLDVTLPADGKYFLTVQDAQDRGGIWHAYELELK